MPSVISGDANVSATEFGFLDGVTSGLQSQIDSKLNLAGGKILQIVRATDVTDRSTTSTTYVDASISVTITPQKSDSAILLIWWALARHITTSDFALFQITDNSNNPVEGSDTSFFGSNSTSDVYAPVLMIGRSTPATTSATTYKGRFRAFSSGTAQINNGTSRGQLYAIEVSA